MGGGYHGGFGATQGNNPNLPIAGEIIFHSEKYQFFINIANRTDIDPNGMYDVVAHGSSTRIKYAEGSYYSARELARILKHRKDYKSNVVRLLSCNTGVLPDGFAQNLANKLNVVVWAPNNLLWAYPSGKHIVAPPSQRDPTVPDTKLRGAFIPFYPGGNRK